MTWQRVRSRRWRGRFAVSIFEHKIFFSYISFFFPLTTSGPVGPGPFALKKYYPSRHQEVRLCAYVILEMWDIFFNFSPFIFLLKFFNQRQYDGFWNHWRREADGLWLWGAINTRRVYAEREEEKEEEREGRLSLCNCLLIYTHTQQTANRWWAPPIGWPQKSSNRILMMWRFGFKKCLSFFQPLLSTLSVPYSVRYLLLYVLTSLCLCV